MQPASSDLFHTGIQSNIIIYSNYKRKTVIPTSFQHIRLFQLQQTPGCPLPTVMPYPLLTSTISQIRLCNNLIIGWITYTTMHARAVPLAQAAPNTAEWLLLLTILQRHIGHRLSHLQPANALSRLSRISSTVGFSTRK